MNTLENAPVQVPSDGTWFRNDATVMVNGSPIDMNDPADTPYPFGSNEVEFPEHGLPEIDSPLAG